MATTTDKPSNHQTSSGLIVKRFRVIGTQTVVYQAWEPSGIRGRHSSVTTVDGQWYGKVGTDPDPALYDHLPVGDERSRNLQQAYQERYAVAYQAIIEACPETADGHRSDGEIEITL